MTRGKRQPIPAMAGLLDVSDKLDIYSVGALLDSCRRMVALPRALIIDLGGAEQIHTAALQVLVALFRAREAAGLPYELCGISPQVAATLVMTGLDTVVSPHIKVEIHSVAA
jgi:anti-anti-sigma factor